MQLVMTSKCWTSLAGDRDDAKPNHSSVLLPFPAVVLQYVLLLLCVVGVRGHGRLVEPPSRASMWRYGYSTKPDFHDNQLWCGGFTVCSLYTSYDMQLLSPPAERSELEEIMRLLLSVCVSVRLSVCLCTLRLAEIYMHSNERLLV